MKPHRCFPTFVTRAGVALFVACAWLAGAFAQAVNTGTLEGRVFDAGRGEFLENARVTIEGTTLETFTDSSGTYRLANVPAGAARVRVAFTGITAVAENVTVRASQTTTHDVTLRGSTAAPAAAGGPVKLDQFVVSTSKEMDAAAIAINEQRVAPNI